MNSCWNRRMIAMAAMGMALVFGSWLEGTGASTLPGISRDEMIRRLESLKQSPYDGKYNEKWVVNSKACRRAVVSFQVKDPMKIDDAGKSQSVQVFRPNEDRPVPAVIVVPSIARENILEPWVAEQLCQHGFGAIVADVNDSSLPLKYPSWGLEDRRLRNGLLALRTTLDFAEMYTVEGRSAFDPKKLGIVGFSLGGISTALMAGIESDRLQAVVITVGGGNLPHVLATSTVPHISLLKNLRLLNSELSDDRQYEEKLKRILKYDPLYFSPLVQTDRVMMVISETDTMVPYMAQDELWKSFRQPTSIRFEAGHILTIADVVTRKLDEILGFLKSRLR